MRNHVPMPDVCPECRKQMGMTIAKNPHQQVVFHHCPHAETVAKVNIENGVVVRWEMARPMSRDQFLDLARRQDETMDQVTTGGKLS